MAKKIEVTLSKEAQESKALATGKLDAFLTSLFAIGGLVLAELLGYLLTLVPMLDTWQGGKYRWLTVPVGIVIGAIVKGIDRKKHEDSSASTGLVKL